MRHGGSGASLQAAWVAEYYPTETVNRDDSGRQTVGPGHRSRVVAGLLLRLAGGARVLSPVGAGDQRRMRPGSARSVRRGFRRLTGTRLRR